MPSNRKIRWGLVSTARINRRLIPALQMSDTAELVAVASRRPEAAIAYAKEWEIPKTFGSYTAMFESADIDAVYISVPNHLHVPLTIEALQHGKAVLCEKPFALLPSDIDRVKEVVHATNGIVAEAFMYRHHPQTKEIGSFIDAGKLGNILSMQAYFHFKLTNANNVRMQSDLGGGCLWDVGVYPISLFQYLMKSTPKEVLGRQLIGDSGVDMHFTGQLHYDNNITAQFSSSFNSAFGMHARIVGDLGRLDIERPFTGLEEPDNKVVFTDNEGNHINLDIPSEYLYLGEVEDIHNAILSGTPTYISLDETKNHILTVNALYRSAKNGQIVKLQSTV